MTTKGTKSSQQNESPQGTNEDFSYTIAKEFKKEISKLSYEDSLEKLDEILTKLQSDSLRVDELKNIYCQGNLYLEHCQSLLNQIEQDVIQIDDENINQYIDKE